MSEHAIKRRAFMDGVAGFVLGQKKEIKYSKTNMEISRKAWERTGKNLQEAIHEQH